MIPPLSKTLFFARHTLSQMSQAALGLMLETVTISCIIVHAASMILIANAQLLWHEPLSMRSWSCKSRIFGNGWRWSSGRRRALHVRKTSHAFSYNKACCPVFRTQRLPGASWMLFVAAPLQPKINLYTAFKKFCSSKQGTSLWNKLELTYLPPARMKLTYLMPIRPKMQEARERLKCGVLSSCNAQK